MTLNKKPVLLLIILIFTINSFNVIARNYPKREFRGAWVHTVDQTKYAAMSQVEMKKYFTSLLDKLSSSGINTVLFQIRPEADAWYKSSYEPWSRYITGTQGKDPGWDPLAFMIRECHSRNMELHAWLNPYRVRNNKDKVLSKDHFYFKNKWWFVEYGNYIWFDPGIPASRKHILNVVKEIVRKYDIDAIHMDDYFYPYPDGKLAFDDSKSFSEYGIRQGYTEKNKADWRRSNVNNLIKELGETIHNVKPWVQFGVSPFGIYRNKKDDPSGSNTNGFTNYDGLYADVLLWVKNGWVDYVVPQLYWEIGHKVADYKTLIDWWAEYSFNVPLYIGQDVLRTMKPDSLSKSQLKRKMDMADNLSAVNGHCFWPAYEVERNAGGIKDSLRLKYFKFKALTPAFAKYDSIPPAEVSNLIYVKNADGSKTLKWKEPIHHNDNDKVKKYVIYGFERDKAIDTSKAESIIDFTTQSSYVVPSKSKYSVFVVTALDRCGNENEGVRLFTK